MGELQNCEGILIMALPWFRMYHEFASDPKIQQMTEAMQRRYIMLLCLQCAETLSTLKERDIAYQLKLSGAELAETKDELVDCGFITSDWVIVNWEKRQFLSDSGAARQREFRQREAAKKKAAKALEKAIGNGRKVLSG